MPAVNSWTGLSLSVLTAEVKYSSRKIALKTARDGEKTWHMTQLTFSLNFYWKICFKFCILEQIIATVLFICISSINNKRSLLRFQSTTAPTNRGWSACGMRNLFVRSRKFAWISFVEARTFSRYFQWVLEDLHFSTLSTNNKRNQRKSWRVNFLDHHLCASRSHNETKLQVIWNSSNNSHRLGAGGRREPRHGNVKGRCACDIIYGSPERHKKILGVKVI